LSPPIRAKRKTNVKPIKARAKFFSRNTARAVPPRIARINGMWQGQVKAAVAKRRYPFQLLL